MQANKLILRCYAEREGDQWVAVCVDLTLAAQADSFQDAKRKLHMQIVSYVRDALGEDREHAEELLTRRAPVSVMAKYYLAVVASKLHATHNRICSFFETMPMQPAAA